jgi:hypothetical protein
LEIWREANGPAEGSIIADPSHRLVRQHGIGTPL